jgi:hypothetical protein
MKDSDYISRFRDAVSAVVDDLERLKLLRNRWEVAFKVMKSEAFVGENAALEPTDLQACIDWVDGIKLPECLYKVMS